MHSQLTAQHLLMGQCKVRDRGFIVGLPLVPLFGTRNNQAQKNREMGGAMAFNVRWPLIKRCNNQRNVGINDGSDFGEEMRPGWSVWADAIPLFGTKIGEETKQIKNKTNCGLDYLAHNNQPKAGIRDRGEYLEGE